MSQHRRTDLADLFGGKSPWVSIYEARYQSLGFDKWNNERVFSLCRSIGCKTEDLCAYAGEFRALNVNRYLKQNRWPLPLVLHFDRIERFITNLRSPGMQDQTAAQMMMISADNKDADMNAEVQRG